MPTLSLVSEQARRQKPFFALCARLSLSLALAFAVAGITGEAEDIRQRQERDFAVKATGSVLSRTVIKSMEGTGLDNTGTEAGFNKAVTAIPPDRTLAFSIEKNADHKKDTSAPEYRLKTVVIQLSEAELMERFESMTEEVGK
jgi:hypothetical protein